MAKNSKPYHPCQPPGVEDPEEVVGGAEEVGGEGGHGQQVHHEEELGVGDDALVEEAVHVAVEERPEDAGDGGVRREEGAEAGDDDHLVRVRARRARVRRVRVRRAWVIVRRDTASTSVMVR